MQISRLKIKLNTFLSNDNSKIDESLAVKLLDECLLFIGISDPEFRESTLLKSIGILISEYICPEKKVSVVESLCGENYLFSLQNSKYKKSFVCRSTSLVLLSALIFSLNAENDISSPLVRKTFTSLIEYMNFETEFRGYDSEFGWIHTIAHTADLIDELVKTDLLSVYDLHLVFESMFKMIKNARTPLNFGENQRVAYCIYGIILKIIKSSKLDIDLFDFENFFVLGSISPKVESEYIFLENKKNIFAHLIVFATVEMTYPFDLAKKDLIKNYE
jgi:Protein of unknown function (DUF2785)